VLERAKGGCAREDSESVQRWVCKSLHTGRHVRAYINRHMLPDMNAHTHTHAHARMHVRTHPSVLMFVHRQCCALQIHTHARMCPAGLGERRGAV